MIFFIVGILIFIFSVGPDKEIYSEIGIGIIWTLFLFSSNLSIRKFYQEDFEDGSIILFFISGISLEFLVILKIITSWIFFQIPFFIIIPIACLLLDVNIDRVLLLILTFAIGSPILTTLASISSSMNLLNKKNFSIGSVIVMILSIPVIIFSVNIFKSPIDLIWPQLSILLSILMLFLAITPWISAECIRIAIRNK
jgi:heme exporter protein B